MTNSNDLWWFVLGHMSDKTPATKERIDRMLSECPRPEPVRQLMSAIVSRNTKEASAVLTPMGVQLKPDGLVHQAVLRHLVIENARRRCEAMLEQIPFQKYHSTTDMPQHLRKIAAGLIAAANTVEHALGVQKLPE